MAQVYAATGDADTAFESLDRTTPTITTILDPFLIPLRGDPRWAAYVARMDPSLEELAATPFEVRRR